MRKAAGLTQEEAANKLNINRHTVYTYRVDPHYVPQCHGRPASISVAAWTWGRILGRMGQQESSSGIVGALVHR